MQHYNTHLFVKTNQIFCRLGRSGACLEIILFPYGPEANDDLLQVADDVASNPNR